LDQVERYLDSVSSRKKTGKKLKVKIEYFGPLDKYEETKTAKKTVDIKKMGYGSPYLIVYREPSSGGRSLERKAILSTMRIGFGFGHDYRADRVDNTVLSFDTWNLLPQHCRVWDVGAFDKKTTAPISLGDAGEFFLLREMVPGTEYYRDLDRILESDRLEESDRKKAEALAEYLAEIHSKKYRGEGKNELYARKIRDTVGHGECIFGLSDSYPPKTEGYLEAGELEEIEKKCISARWRLKGRSERLSQVHGDFHPWNILFKGKGNPKLLLLDRSRGQWGEPADDVCALSINYLFYSLRKNDEIRGNFHELFKLFMDRYSERAKDSDLSSAMPLFYVFRALVIASPVWYPALSSEIRRKIFNFSENLLNEGTFDYLRVNDYFRDVST
jgi:hypothetical protein